MSNKPAVVEKRLTAQVSYLPICENCEDQEWLRDEQESYLVQNNRNYELCLQMNNMLVFKFNRKKKAWILVHPNIVKWREEYRFVCMSEHHMFAFSGGEQSLNWVVSQTACNDAEPTIACSAQAKNDQC